MRQAKLHACALAAYGLAALLFSWPLPLHLGTHLTGAPDGDTGVYVWNQWVFHHELVENNTLPYFTGRIFSLTGRTDLSLHNYTTFQNLLALPLMPLFGVVATFNIVYLLVTVLTGYTTFLLARFVVASAPEAWLAGLAFAWSPTLITRAGGHFSLVAAAPLALFMLLLLRTEERQHWRDAAALGAAAWWCASTDVYFAVYALLLAACYLGARLVTVQRSPMERSPTVAWVLNVLLVSLAGVIAALVISQGWQFRFLGRTVSMRGLYTPVLVFSVLAVVRMAWHFRAKLRPVDRGYVVRLTRVALAGAIIAATLLAPVIYAVAVRVADGRFTAPPVFWRTSSRGVDLLAFLAPNPNHPLAPDALVAWLSLPRADSYLENVASVPWAMLVVILLAWRTGHRAPRLWVGLAAAFALLALGPFIHVAGMNTHVPGPWAFLRYLPLVGLARTPARFSIVMLMAVAVLFAWALCALSVRWPARRPLIVGAAALLLVAELWPVPRQLYSAAVPSIYAHVAAAPGDVRVLELPTGVRDGASSHGNYTARSQFFQTMHGKPLFGGYLSRVSRRRIDEMRRYELLDGLIDLSEGKRLSPAREMRLIARGPSFVERTRLGFVVVDRARASDALRDFALRAFNLRHVATDGPFELYRPE